jgi:hypothetical protein
LYWLVAASLPSYEVAVAVDQHLPAHLHRLGIHAGEQRAVLAAVLAAGIGQWRGELAAAEDAGRVVDLRVYRVALVREDAVEALHVGQLGDLVADEVVEPDARDAAVDLVVDPGVAAVVVAVLVGGVRVVGVAHRVAQRAIGLGAHDLLGLVGDAPADQRVRHEAGDAQQLAARGQAQHAHVAGVAAAPEAVVGVELAGLQMGAVGFATGRSGSCATGGGCRGGAVGLLVGAGHGAEGQAGHRCAVDEPPTRQTLGRRAGARRVVVLVVVFHGLTSGLIERNGMAACGWHACSVWRVEWAAWLLSPLTAGRHARVAQARRQDGAGSR